MQAVSRVLPRCTSRATRKAYYAGRRREVGAKLGLTTVAHNADTARRRETD